MRRRRLLAGAGAAASLGLGGCVAGYGGPARVAGPPARLLPEAGDLPGAWRNTTADDDPAGVRRFEGGPHEALLTFRARVFEDVGAARAVHEEAVGVLAAGPTAAETVAVDVGDEAVLYHPIFDWRLVQFRERNAVGRVVYDEHDSTAAALAHAERFHRAFVG